MYLAIEGSVGEPLGSGDGWEGCRRRVTADPRVTGEVELLPTRRG